MPPEAELAEVNPAVAPEARPALEAGASSRQGNQPGGFGIGTRFDPPRAAPTQHLPTTGPLRNVKVSGVSTPPEDGPKLSLRRPS